MRTKFRFMYLVIFTFTLILSNKTVKAQTLQNEGVMSINGLETDGVENPFTYNITQSVAFTQKGQLAAGGTNFHAGCDRDCFTKNFLPKARSVDRGATIAWFTREGLTVSNETLDEVLNQEVKNQNFRIETVDFGGISADVSCLAWKGTSVQRGKITRKFGVKKFIIWRHNGVDFCFKDPSCLNSPYGSDVFYALRDDRAKIVSGSSNQGNQQPPSRAAKDEANRKIIAETQKAGQTTTTSTTDADGRTTVHVTTIFSPTMINEGSYSSSTSTGGTHTNTVTSEGGGSGARAAGNGTRWEGLSEPIVDLRGTTTRAATTSSGGGCNHSNGCNHGSNTTTTCNHNNGCNHNTASNSEMTPYQKKMLRNARAQTVVQYLGFGLQTAEFFGADNKLQDAIGTNEQVDVYVHNNNNGNVVVTDEADMGLGGE